MVIQPDFCDFFYFFSPYFITSYVNNITYYKYFYWLPGKLIFKAIDKEYFVHASERMLC